MRDMLNVRLRADQAMRLLPIQEGPEAKWNVIFPRGEWHGANLASIGGSIKLNDALFAEMIQHWQDAGRPSLPVTFHHVDSEDAPGVTPEEKKKAAGWIEDLRVGVDGLEGLIKWTDTGKARVRADEYRYSSPEWAPQHIDRRTGEVKGWWLYGTVLTNEPFFNTLPKMAATETPRAEAIQAAQTQPTGEAPRGARMDRKRLCAALGMPETSTDEEVMAAIEAKCKAALPADESKLTAAIREVAEPLKATLAEQAKKVAQLEAANAKLLSERIDGEISMLAAELAAKKALPVNRAAMTEKIVAFAKKTSVAEAREVYSALPDAAPVTGELGVTGAPDGGHDLIALKAAYDKGLDDAAKAGENLILASRRLRADPKFKPLMAANAKSLTHKDMEN